MGGIIQVVNKINNKLYKQTRHTNGLPNYVYNKKFFDCDVNYINEYINKKDIYRTDDDDFLAPNLDLFDFDDKIIYTYQSYCSYKAITYSEVYINANKNTYKELFDDKYLIPTDNGEVIDGDDFFDVYEKMGKSPTYYNCNFEFDWVNIGWELLEYNNLKNYHTIIKDKYGTSKDEDDIWERYINE